MPGRFGNSGRHGRGHDKPVVGREERLVPAYGNHFTACVSARQAYGGGGGIGAIEAELDHLGARDELDQAFRGLKFDTVRADEVDAVLQPPAHRPHHRLKPVSQ